MRKGVISLKQIKKIFVFAVVGFILCIGQAKAVEISDEDYSRLRNAFSAARISVMTEEEINEYLEYDLENAESTSIYYKGTSVNNGSYTWTQVSKEEYDNASNIMPRDKTKVSTNYKELKLTTMLTASNDVYYFSLTNVWKYIPTVRSFDVIAFRFLNIAMLENSQSGNQVYRKENASTYNNIGYSPNGTNISNQSAGFGISMNLVDDDIEELELSINALGMKATSNAIIYGSYQHAIQYVTLAQSKEYTISAAGYGHVINFSVAQQNKYDNMDGVYQSL